MMPADNDLDGPDGIALDLYAAVLDQTSLEPALVRLTHALGATTQLTLSFWTENQQAAGATVAASHGFDAAFLDAYHAGIWRHDPWLRAGTRLPPGLINMDRHVTRAALGASLYWNEFGLPRDGPFHCLALKFDALNGLQGGFAVHRRRGAEPFGAREEAVLRTVAPHLRRVLAARARLPAVPGGALEAALDALDRGAAILEAGGRLIFANAALRALAARQDGLALGPYGLRPADPLAARAVHQAQMTALAAAHGKLRMMEGVARSVVPRGACEPPYVVEAIPLRQAADDARPAFLGALLLVTDTAARPSPRANLLREAFGLTPAEATLAAGLAAGRTLSDLARARGVSPETLRSQLAAIFRKTGCHRQADLVGLMARLLDG